MKEMFEKHLETHLKRAKQDYKSNKENMDLAIWFISVLNKSEKLSCEEDLLRIYQAYLYAIVNTDQIFHDTLLIELYKFSDNIKDNNLLDIMKNLRFIFDSKDEKEKIDNLQQCLDNLFIQLYNQGRNRIKKALDYIRDNDAKCPPMLLFLIDIIKLLNCIIENEAQVWELMLNKLKNIDFSKEETYSYVTELFAMSIAFFCDNETMENVALKLSIISLSFKDPEDQAWAFAFCAALALFLKKYQLCYDICFSWLNKNSLGELSDVPVYFNEETSKWREREGQFFKNLINEFMAYTCITIHRMLPRNCEQSEVFLFEALNYSETAALGNYTTDTSLQLYAEILYESQKYDKALSHMWLCYKRSSKDSDRLIRLKNCIDIQLELLCQPDDFESCLKFSPEENNNLYEDKPLLSKNIEALIYLYNSVTDFKKKKELSANEKDAVEQSKYFVEILNAVKNLNFRKDKSSVDCSQNITCILLCICNVVRLIRQQMRYKTDNKQIFFFRNHFDTEPNKFSDSQALNNKEKIAYYTTLDNLKFLFNKLYQDTNDDKPYLVDLKEKNIDNKIKEGSKNCLTMMHAYYMNDPNEGLTLLNELSKEIDSGDKYPNLLFRKLSPVLFRDQLYDGQFVFLKSFTNLIDQLNMWSMYASDRRQNTDSNGCCVCIAPETLDMMDPAPNPAEYLFEAGGIQFRSVQNDYHLYEVAYVDNGKIISKNEQLKENYKKLKKLFVLLNETLYINKLNSDENMEIIHRVLQKTLSPIVFLFKDASYRAEQERRIVIHKDKDELDAIGTTNQNPPKLFINPYHQVFVEELILGPKVESPDQWIPYLQYELTKMWETWPKSVNGTRNPIVRKSNINYRD